MKLGVQKAGSQLGQEACQWEGQQAFLQTTAMKTRRTLLFHYDLYILGDPQHNSFVISRT